MVGKLWSRRRTCSIRSRSQNANWTDSADKGIGWDAADGPIADMSAKGVTGNTLPNNNEMGGRSGEGRSGKSQGELVGDDSAVARGAGGRRRGWTPRHFRKARSRTPAKTPAAARRAAANSVRPGRPGPRRSRRPEVKQQMQRLAEKQAQLRNEAERLNLQYQLSRYDNFKLAESVAPSCAASNPICIQPLFQRPSAPRRDAR